MCSITPHVAEHPDYLRAVLINLEPLRGDRTLIPSPAAAAGVS